ncbi:Eco57I restriction-modification methylase domain-containing protein [Haloferax sp. DFSO60]|uniref:Eco57I restriction-modification methylase domain-containing protein n=1 Tax=Haloferax sp. DFSO60 TaxID=3388652 RepID=UPI0039798ECC
MSQQSHPYRTNRDLFSNHYLTEHLRQTEPWEEAGEDEVREAYDEIRDLWEDKQDRVADYNEAQLERNFIRPIFDILGIPFEIEETVMRNARRPDYGFFPSSEAADAAFDREDFYEEAIAVADAKRWGRKLDTRGEEKRDFENPSYQIHAYLQETPPQWAVLTNGEQWRLYYEPTSHRLDSYYEINLPELFKFVEGDGGIEDFKDFYLFFRQQAFLLDRSGDCFLDNVYDESSVFAEAIGEDLQNNIYEAIRVLAEGFLDTNDNLGEDDLPLVHDSSLIYLYRLIFVLYAESEGRDLLPTDNDIYSNSYSLNELKQTVADKRDQTQQHYQTFQTHLWDRLDELFVLIDQGSQGKDIPQDQLYIPAYNGGLFRINPDPDDSAEAQFLATHEVDDAHLAEVIELMTRRDADEGDGQVFVDYSSLDERHLGSIYEGLLEYKLDIADKPLAVENGEYTTADSDEEVAVQEDEVYLQTDDGERKATGSYYTPEYIVEYIVEETLGPLVDDIREDLLAQDPFDKEGGGQFAEDFAERVFDLKILDPAMGSGHFPVNAVDYLAREIIDAQERQDQQAARKGNEEAISEPMTEEGELRDINWARRQVVQKCIYGVDLNPLATELAKVSLWLRTLAAKQPLAFLDHHLKTGNSLVGSDITVVLSDDSESSSGQLTLSQSFARARQQTLGHVMDLMQDLLSIENEELADIKSMEELYDEIQDDPLYGRLFEIANVHTAEQFGVDVPKGVYQEMAGAIDDVDAWAAIQQKSWFTSAQALADEEDIFHWELEYPEVFFNEDGEKLDEAGFDAVIGNPPYVNIQNLRSNIKSQVDYFNSYYQTSTGKFDIYVVFCERGLSLCSTNGYVSYIMPNKFFTADYGEGLRSYLNDGRYIRQVVDFGDSQIFPGLSTYTGIFILGDNSGDSFKYINSSPRELLSSGGLELKNSFYETLHSEYWIFCSQIEYDILNKIEGIESSKELTEVTQRIFQGVNSGKDSVYILEPISNAGDLTLVKSKLTGEEHLIETEILFPILKGKDIGRYEISDAEYVVLYPYKSEKYGKTDRRPLSEEELSQSYQKAWEYLNIPEVKSELKSRQYLMDAVESEGAGYSYWYEMWKPRRLEWMQDKKLLTQVLAKRTSFALDYTGEYFFVGGGTAGGNGIVIDGDERYIQSLLNSKITTFYLKKRAIPYQNNYFSFGKGTIKNLPIILEEHCDQSDKLSNLSAKMSDLNRKRGNLNLNLLDHLGSYSGGQTLADIGLTQPTSGSSDSILQETTEEKPNLRVGEANVVRESETTVEVLLSARYKPEDEDAYETDRWGYTETDLEPALRITDITTQEADLIKAFVPVAVDKAGGFAEFRETATKTNSLVDRLRKLTLPRIADVEDGLTSYVQTKQRADKIDAKIEETDSLIDEIVYELYDLTNEEIEIVEDAVAGD